MEFKVGQRVRMTSYEEQKRLGLKSYYQNLANKVLVITEVNSTGIFNDKYVQMLRFDEEDGGGVYAMRFKLAYKDEEFE